MWARVLEFSVACWLAMSPFIFQYSSDETFLWIGTYLAACTIVAAALVSYVPRLEKLHLIHLATGALLIGAAFFAVEPPAPPAYQNFACTGLVLMMLAIVPSRSHLPPRPWREFYLERQSIKRQ